MSSQNNFAASVDKLRVDKWLWMVRLFKTRTVASDACNAGKVKINGVNCKPSREVKTGDELHVRIDQLQKTVQIIALPKTRIPAQYVPDFYIDKTPEEEYERIKQLATHVEYRDRGTGRPTKRDRRQLDYLKDFLSEE
jgi:ribosome-associated heat shock protein Hsp15